jgi:hypothetical protein
MDGDDVLISNDEVDSSDDNNESWLAEQARLVLLEDGG